jgi:hypothetical protein
MNGEQKLRAIVAEARAWVFKTSVPITDNRPLVTILNKSDAVPELKFGPIEESEIVRAIDDSVSLPINDLLKIKIAVMDVIELHIPSSLNDGEKIAAFLENYLSDLKESHENLHVVTGANIESTFDLIIELINSGEWKTQEL